MSQENNHSVTQKSLMQQQAETIARKTREDVQKEHEQTFIVDLPEPEIP